VIVFKINPGRKVQSDREYFDLGYFQSQCSSDHVPLPQESLGHEEAQNTQKVLLLLSFLLLTIRVN
jgi:hypothetical protein